MSSIDEIKARIDIVDLVSPAVQLRRTGKNYIGFCPFHSNTRTPAFVVFPETGTWRCFGQCNEGGDIFGYLMKKEGWDFSEALRYLADKAGVVLKPVTPEQAAAREENDALRNLLEEALIFFRHQLLQTPAGGRALEYLHQRGLSDNTIEIFGLGYAPDAWESLITHFKGRRTAIEELNEAGLVSEREGGGFHDRFHHRIMFPIRDENGRMAGFGARILKPDDMPKFLNSPQTPVFDKGRLLYGLDRARKAIRSREQAVIVEGYLDVIALHQAGYENVVSPMGTALTEQQLYLLKRFTRRLVLALDPDAAGLQATLRGLELARQTMDHSNDPVFDARGLLGFEARLQADIRVTTLPDGLDPDEVVKRDPQEWERILIEAKPIVAHVMDTLAASHNLQDPKEKEAVAQQILPLIADLASPVERDTYLQRLARLLRVDERTLLGETRNRSRQPYRSRQAATRIRSTQAAAAKPALTSRQLNQEGHVVGVLLRRPDLLYQIDRQLQEQSLDRLQFDDFQEADHQTIMGLIRASVDQDRADPLHYVMDQLSLPMLEVADTLLALTEKLDPNDERVLEDVLRAVVQLRQNSTNQSIEYLRFMMEEAQQQGDLQATQYQKTMVQHTLTLRKLNQALGRYTSRVNGSTQ